MSDTPISISTLERLTLVNQFRILEQLHKDDSDTAKEYAILREIVENGYVDQYPKLMEGISEEELPQELLRETCEILEMYTAFSWSSESFAADDKLRDAIKFAGFDHNNEGDHLRYATFLQKRGQFKELHIFDSHGRRLERYRRMWEKWSQLGKKMQLSRAEIEAVLEAGTFSAAR